MTNSVCMYVWIVLLSNSSSSLVFLFFTAGQSYFKIQQPGKLGHLRFVEFQADFSSFPLQTSTIHSVTVRTLVKAYIVSAYVV